MALLAVRPRLLSWAASSLQMSGPASRSTLRTRAAVGRRPAVAGSAARPGGQDGGGIVAGRQSTTDGLHDLGGEGDLTDTGVALGAGFEAAAELPPAW